MSSDAWVCALVVLIVLLFMIFYTQMPVLHDTVTQWLWGGLG